MTGFLSAVDHEEQQHEEHHEVEDEDEHGRPRQNPVAPRDGSFPDLPRSLVAKSAWIR